MFPLRLYRALPDAAGKERRCQYGDLDLHSLCLLSELAKQLQESTQQFPFLKIQPNNKKKQQIISPFLYQVLLQSQTLMQSSFSSKLKDLHYAFPQSQYTQNLQNTRLNQKYLIFNLIAVGSHSLIYYGIEETSGEERAFKCYNLKEIQHNRSFKDKQLCKRLSNYEYQIMMGCDSMHVLKCYDIFQNRECKVVVLEYCNFGSLADEILKKRSKHISESQAVRILKSVISALKNMHLKVGRFHKNLKARNVLNRNGIYKLIDFGLPVVLDEEEQSNSKENFQIPQIILKKHYDQKAEVWSVGVLLHEILFGERPHALTHHNTKSYLISSSVKTIFKRLDDFYSENVYDFLERCLCTNANERMTWRQMEDHQLLKIYDNEGLLAESVSSISSKPEPVRQLARISQILPIQEDLQYPESQSNEKKSFSNIYQQKFLLDMEKRQLDIQLQKVYIKLGDSLELTNLKPQVIQALKKQINTKDYQRFKTLNHYYLQCLKVDFFYNDVIKIMKDLPSIQRNRKNIEFMFLMVSRCFFQISKINSLRLKEESDEFLLACITKEISKLYEEVTNSWNYYSKKLESQQNQFLNIFFDRISRMKNSETYEQKEKFFVAIQEKDYTRQEQIGFTVQFFWENIEKELMLILDEVIDRKKIQKNYEKMETNILRILKYLRVYEQIWNLTLQSNPYASLQEYIHAEIIKET